MRVAPGAGRLHLQHLALAFREFLHDGAGVLVIDIDDDFFDRLQALAVSGSSFLIDHLRAGDASSKPSRRMVSISTAS